jgi:protein TIF31
LKTPPSEPAAEAFENFNFDDQSLEIASMYKFSELSLPTCIKQIALSGWNPVSPQRKLSGDLLYLTVTTLENKAYEIICNTEGFYVSASNGETFNPKHLDAGRPHQAHSLVTLLKTISPKFKAGFTQLQKVLNETDPLEIFSAYEPIVNHPWLTQPSNLVRDDARIAEPYLSHGVDLQESSLRDWNDEFQSLKELPIDNLSERVLKDRLQLKLYQDYIACCIKGAIAVSEGSLVPLNPHEDPNAQMYMYNNLFLSKGFDGLSQFAQYGGELAAYVATGKDIAGLQMVNMLQIPEVHTLGSVVIDYKGDRITCQTVLPGIFRQLDKVMYGSNEAGTHFGDDAEFHELAGKIAKALHLKPHEVEDEDGKKVIQNLSVDTKGLKGTDGRKYFVDMHRFTPVDIEFLEQHCESEQNGLPVYPHKIVTLRPELIRTVYDARLREWKEKKIAEKKAEEAANEPEKKEGETEAETEKEQPIESSEVKLLRDAEKYKIDESEFDLRFNPDSFCHIAQHEGKEKTPEQVQDEQEVREASKFLQNTVIPNFVNDISGQAVNPLDGRSLVNLLHARGINMRYLGIVLSQIEKVESLRLNTIKSVFLQEIVARSAKVFFRDQLKQVPHFVAKDCISHLLNCLLGSASNPTPKSTYRGKTTYEYQSLTSEQVFAEIIKLAALKFRYVLSSEAIASLNPLVLLRNVTKAVGFQLNAKDYKFASAQAQSNGTTQHSNIFTPEDVISIVPRIKSCLPRITYPDEALEAGKIYFAQEQRNEAMALVMESLTLHEQVFGLIHPSTGRCFSALASLHFHTGEYKLAEDYQKKAILILERTYGIDDTETLHAYLEYGFYLCNISKTQEGLKILEHALTLWAKLYGTNNLEISYIDQNMGILLQRLGHHDLSLKFYHRMANTCTELFGEDHLAVAKAYSAIAKNHAFKNDFKQALNYEKKAYNIYSNTLGEENETTKSSSKWLSDFTYHAVNVAKQEQVLGSAKFQQLKEKAQKEMELQLQGIKNIDEVPAGVRGNLPLDQLVKYINDDSSKKSKSSRRSRANKRKVVVPDNAESS